ncbi:RHS/YD repeat-containing protein [Streptomyces laurentii]|uniref:RHS/YD repeat-containing protein n=1 Tax=Streptomyces laurentii TaxID=39478 RepID=A0A160P243_STRLU|nr:RHS/YD repeat-containing protein [Streptomyces laurentii]
MITPDGTEWRYVYDPLGRRIAKHSPTETVHFTWDGTILCEQSTDSVTLTWDHAGLHPLSQTERRRDTDETRFFAIVTDLVGTPTELVDESGELAWRARSTLWGTTAWTRTATAYTPLRFPGQYFDPESGLHYNFFRYYDPEPARYLTPDPLGLAPAPNPATYVHNPHTWSDPLGLAPTECPRGIYEFRPPNPNFPPDAAIMEAMRSAPIGGNIDCSEIAEWISKRSPHGKIINLTTPDSSDLKIPEAMGSREEFYRYHDVYTDGRYVYDPAMSSNPIPYGDYERAIRLLNPGKKLVVGNGGYDGPLW